MQFFTHLYSFISLASIANSLAWTSIATVLSKTAQAQIDRAHGLQDTGHNARPGCTKCKAFDRDNIVLPLSNTRRLTSVPSAPLQAEVLTNRALAKGQFKDQTLTSRFDFTEDTSSDKDTMSIDQNKTLDASDAHSIDSITSSAAFAAHGMQERRPGKREVAGVGRSRTF